MSVWREIEGAIEDNAPGKLPLDFSQNYGVPIGWYVNTDVGVTQQDVSDVTP